MLRFNTGAYRQIEPLSVLVQTPTAAPPPAETPAPAHAATAHAATAHAATAHAATAHAVPFYYPVPILTPQPSSTSAAPPAPPAEPSCPRAITIVIEFPLWFKIAVIALVVLVAVHVLLPRSSPPPCFISAYAPEYERGRTVGGFGKVTAPAPQS